MSRKLECPYCRKRIGTVQPSRDYWWGYNRCLREYGQDAAFMYRHLVKYCEEAITHSSYITLTAWCPVCDTSVSMHDRRRLAYHFVVTQGMTKEEHIIVWSMLNVPDPLVVPF